MQGGVKGAEIQVGTIYDSGDGFLFSPQQGRLGRIEDVAITHFMATTVSSPAHMPCTRSQAPPSTFKRSLDSTLSWLLCWLAAARPEHGCV
jgi:hypothetical protein